MLIKRTASALFIAALLLIVFAADASASDSLYWSNYSSSQVGVTALDGSGASFLDSTGASIASPFGTAIDTQANRVYIANQGGNISYVNLNGSGGGDLNTSGAAFGIPSGIAVWPAGGKVFWTNQNSAISYANLDGSGGGVLDTTGTNPVANVGLTVDPSNNRIYWADSSSNTINYANLDGSGSGGVLSTTPGTLDGPTGVAIDSTTGKIYWSNQNSNNIGYANLDGSGGGILPSSGLSAPEGVSVDPGKGLLYTGSYNTDTLFSVALDGSGATTLIDTAGASPNGPSYPVIYKAPVNNTPPVLTLIQEQSTNPALVCSPGTWKQDALEAFLYQSPSALKYSFYKDGVPIQVNTASNAISASGSGSYVCAVNATNTQGTAVAASNSVNVAKKSTLPSPVASALAISNFRLSANKFRVGNKPTPLASPSGTQIMFDLNADARVKFWIKHVPNRQPRKPSVTGFSRRLSSGAQSVRFTGVFPGGKIYKPGKYQLFAQAIGSDGQRSEPVSVTYRVLKALKQTGGLAVPLPSGPTQ